MKFCPGQCRYLLAVYELCREKSLVRSVDVAKYLSVTRPSVSRMLKCMANMELIASDYSTNIVLTELGRDTAKSLHSKYTVIKCFFMNILKLPEKEASEQSIIFLVNFPEDTIEKLSKITKNTMNKRRNQKAS